MLDIKSRVKAVPTDASEYLAPAWEVKDGQFDWWSKFYASLQNPELKEKEYDELKLDKLVVRLNTVSVRMLLLHFLTLYTTGCSETLVQVAEKSREISFIVG